MKMQSVKNKTEKRGQYAFLCRINTNRPKNIKKALESVRRIRPRKSNKNYSRPSKNRWRIRFTKENVINNLNIQDKILKLVQSTGFLNEVTNTAVTNMFKALDNEDANSEPKNDSAVQKNKNLKEKGKSKKPIHTNKCNTIGIGCWNAANKLTKTIGEMETYVSDLGVKILGVTEVGKTRPDCKKYEFFGNVSHEKK